MGQSLVDELSKRRHPQNIRENQQKDKTYAYDLGGASSGANAISNKDVLLQGEDARWSLFNSAKQCAV